MNKPTHFKFKCTGCGKCCTGFSGYVWLTDDDIEVMCKKLKLPRDEFLSKYTRLVGTRYSLLEKSEEEEFDCIFLQDKKICTLYDARPTQCKTYPFWPEIIRDAESWEKEKASCEGIDHEDGDIWKIIP